MFGTYSTCYDCLTYVLSFMLLIQVLHAFATEGAHCSSVREILDASDVSLLFFFLVSFSSDEEGGLHDTQLLHRRVKTLG